MATVTSALDLRGVWIPLITPFDKSGAVDTAAIERLCGEYLAAGVTGIVALGTTGETPVLDAVIQRAKTQGVRMVIVAGEIIYRDGKFGRIDRDAALRQLSEILKRPLSGEEIERRQLAKAVFPHVKAFYDGYCDIDIHTPHYRQNSRV